MSGAQDPEIRLRLVLGGEIVIGPGKADLLEGIAATGSIAAAGRRMGMSYKRAWGLVETMNAVFADPVVESARGGAKGGGARLTETGRKVLDAYRRFEGLTREAGKAEIAAIAALIGDMAGRK